MNVVKVSMLLGYSVGGQFTLPYLPISRSNASDLSRVVLIFVWVLFFSAFFN